MLLRLADSRSPVPTRSHPLGIAACALLFLVVFSCSNCSGNEESYRKLESHA